MITARARIVFADVLQDFQAADIGEAYIQQDKVGNFSLCDADTSVAVGGFHNLIAPLLAFLPQRPADELFVVDY